MSKNKKSTRYLYLHRVPFVLLWMSTYAMGWAVAILLLLGLVVISTALRPILGFEFMNILINDLPNLFMAGVGLTVGVATAWAQPWLVRQRSGMVLRGWRPLMIVSYLLAGVALTPVLLFELEGNIGVGHFLWFAIPAVLPLLSLRRIVSGAGQWLLTGLVSGSVALASYGFFLSLNLGDLHPFGLLFGTLVQSAVTAMMMTRLLNNSREESQLAAGATTTGAALTESADTTRGYLHHVPYMLLWLMTQGVGWMFVFLVTLMLLLVTSLSNSVNQWLIDLSPVLTVGGAGLIYGVFSAWAQPWLMRLRTGLAIRNWRLSTIVATTLAAALGALIVNMAPFTTAEQAAAHTMGLALWFLAPILPQTLALWRKGHNAWLWLITGVASAAVSIMLFNQIMSITGDALSLAFLAALGFGQVVNVLLTGMVSLQILEAPDEQAAADKAKDAQPNTSRLDTAQTAGDEIVHVGLALLTSYNDEAEAQH